MIQTTLRIANLDREDVDFFLNPAQRDLDSKIAQMRLEGRPVRMYIPKARRRGISAYITARFLVKTLTDRNVKAAIVAHKGKESIKLFEKVKYYLKHIKTAPATLKYDTKMGISLPDTDSTFTVYTAGSEEVARGLDENHVHLSELAFYDDPASLIKSLGQTVPISGELFGESTGNGQMTWYHRQCMRVASGEGGKWDYGFAFYSSQSNPDNFLPLTPLETEDIKSTYPSLKFKEKELERTHPGLSWEFIAWRRWKIREADYDIWDFKQEHPMTLDECFIPGARSYFHYVYFTKDDLRWKQEDPTLWKLKDHPAKHLHYAIGVDVAAGVEEDSSVIEIICLETNEQVLEFRSNKIPPDDLALMIEDLGKMFFWPIVLIEANNHGHVTLDNLVNHTEYPSEMIFWDESHSTNITEAGHATTKRTKPLLIGHLRRAFANDLRVYSSVLMGECSTFTEELKADKECHDDTVVAMSLAGKV